MGRMDSVLEPTKENIVMWINSKDAIVKKYRDMKTKFEEVQETLNGISFSM